MLHSLFVIHVAESDIYRKIPLIRPGHVYGQKTIHGPIFGEGTFIRVEKHFNLQSAKLFLFFSVESTYFTIFHAVQDLKYVQN